MRWGLQLPGRLRSRCSTCREIRHAAPQGSWTPLDWNQDEAAQNSNRRMLKRRAWWHSSADGCGFLSDLPAPETTQGKHRRRVACPQLRGVDLNHRPLGYEPNELPGCSTPHFD